MDIENKYMPARPGNGHDKGLTKLEEFTKAAMMGILSNPESASINYGRAPEGALSVALLTLEELEKYEKTKVAP